MSVKRILKTKYHAGLHRKDQLLSPRAVKQNHDQPVYRAVIAQAAQQSLTVLNNNEDHIPFNNTVEKKLVVQVGTPKKSLYNELQRYGAHDLKILNENPTQKQIDHLITLSKTYKQVIFSLENMSRRPSKRFGISLPLSTCLEEVVKHCQATFVLFGTPYGLNYLPDQGVKIISYESQPIFKQKTAELLYGSFIARGKLPVSAGNHTAGEGEKTNSLKRLSQAIPEEVFLSSDSLLVLDKLIDTLIRDKAAPGCQLYIAKDGKVIWNKSYGAQTYGSGKKITNQSIYDLASITKVATTTLSIMKLHEEGVVDIFKPIKDYIPEADTTQLADLMLYDIMAHHAGLKPWIPFYASTLTDGKYKRPKVDYYAKEPNGSFQIEVTDKLYLLDSYPDSILHQILQSEVRPSKHYVYSDLGFYLLAEIIRRKTGMRIDAYADKHFYEPLGLRATGFNAYQWDGSPDIVPSELDNYWRHTVLKGRVHDMGAAMLHGVSGHAGLFSSAQELGVLFQMILNNGYYGGRQYLKPETIKLFTKRHPRSTRRGIGWDMKQMDSNKMQNMADEASPFTYGHSGFTGTVVWIDPAEDLVFIFLSNRTYPSMRSNTLHKKNYRPRLQQIVYKALKK